jgi:hypothetical protein
MTMHYFKTLSPPAVHVYVEPRAGYHEDRTEADLDEALVESFPASDPPAWNQGMVRPEPTEAGRLEGSEAGRLGGPEAGRLEGSEAERPTRAALRLSYAAPHVDGFVYSAAEPRRTVLQSFAAQAGALGVILLVPFAILALGAPIMVAIRALLELLGWMR